MATLRARYLPELIFLILLIPFSLWVWVGIPQVPFHPDESTFLYMSSDWEGIFRDPASLAWQPGGGDPRQRYRLLDAPIGRYLAGAARSLAGLPPLPSDWDWSATWEQNQASGALPGVKFLQAGRLGSASLLPFSLALIYLTGVRLSGRFLGWSAALLFGLNALILLHTRRAQAEGGLVFFICLTLACLVCCRKRPWLVAIPAALAFCAKQSALPLAAAGLAAVWVYQARPLVPRRLLVSLGLYAALFTGIVFLLNPFLWAHPWEAAQAAVTARQEFLAEQTRTYQDLAPGMVLDSPLETSFSILANLYLVPPSFAESGNYLDQIRPSIEQYLSSPLHQLFRSLPGGGILLALSLAGCAAALWKVFRPGQPRRAEWGLVGLAGILVFGALALTITLPFQRYVLPLVPFTALFPAYTLDRFRERFG